MTNEKINEFHNKFSVPHFINPTKHTHYLWGVKWMQIISTCEHEGFEWEKEL